ncbi:hypothetical protein FDP41_009653 [Naegleria fowleri]|uniref:Uncharacterized protein n=1 Tax=Naegleria fowleri TaxID=5763 RepID=A0A6A5B041_NAEFO|nr:uncharacterized protein FDP41_009653 [Naegleria fowleri]KAF0971957.1 hypothetical protein FDP41_009653 [Naegleria fowleri]CAG4709142.1 unnamed protein product [Naegleria fowleri]
MSHQFSPLILEKVKEGVLSVCFNTFDFLLLRRANSEIVISKIILEFIERNVYPLKKVRKLVKNCFIYCSKYSQRKIILFDWLFYYPLLENTAWKQLENNLVKLFGSGIFAIEIEPGVLYMKETIKYCCRPYMSVESCLLRRCNNPTNYFQKIESTNLIDYDIVAYLSRKVIEQIVNVEDSKESFEQNIRKHIKRSQHELNDREGKFLDILIHTLFSELEFKKQPTRQEKIMKFISEWQGNAKLEIVKQMNLEKQKQSTDKL